MTGSGPLTKRVIDSWRPLDLTQVSVKLLVDAIRSNSVAAAQTVDGLPLSSWRGLSRSAANARANDQYEWAKKVSAAIEDLETALKKAGKEIYSYREVVSGALFAASLQRCYLVSDDDPAWTMKYRPGSGGEDENLTPAQIAERERSNAGFVKSKADELYAVVSDHASAISVAISAIATAAPAKLTLSAQDGRRDALLGEDGWTDSEAEFVGNNLRAAGLTEDQIRRLLDGEKLSDVPQGAQEYLHMFFKNLSGDQLLNLDDKFKDMGTPQGDAWSSAIGRGILTLSNENVGRNSGYEYLPSWLREWARDPSSGSAKDAPTSVWMARLLNDGTGGMPAGERFGADLQRKSATISARNGDGTRYPDAAFIDPRNPEQWDPNNRDASLARYHNTIEKLFDVGARNHLSSAAVLSGEYTDGTALSNYDRDETLRRLFTYEWTDDGESVGKLMDWVGEYGRSDDPSKVELADRAFKGLFDYTTTTESSDGDNNFAALMDANRNDDAIGKINPELADALRRAAKPYLNILAGGIPSEHGHPGLSFDYHDDEKQARAARLFTLIASDNTFVEPSEADPNGEVGAGARLYRDILEQSIANGARAGAGSMKIEFNDTHALAELSENLQALGRAGLHGAEFDLQGDHSQAAQDRNAADTRIRNIVSSASAAATAIPNPYWVAAGAAGTALTPWLLPPEPTGELPVNLNYPVESSTEHKLHFYYGVLAGSELPPISDRENWYGEDGELKPLPTILAEHNGNTGQIYSDITRHLRFHRRSSPGAWCNSVAA